MVENLTRSRGEHYSIQELATMASHGELRIPEFQRSFRWESGDVLALFDSILRGYPVGSVLLWKKAAPAGVITLGAITIESAEQPNALWVVDGQQRITSLVNAVSADSFELDDRFRIVYSLNAKKFARSKDGKGALFIPLPDLFDVSRLLSWLQENPEAQQYAGDIQNVTARLRDFKLPASVVDQADESVLRDIFDRMNTAGKRLRGAEIFDAIHRATGEESGQDLSIGAIADRIAASTTFGRLDDATIYQAILVRRHPEITRDPHAEFNNDRHLNFDFSGEGRDDGYRHAETALKSAITFLTDIAGVPHVTFLPYRFLLLIVTRYFALFPGPKPRNIELLSRWIWVAATRATELNLSGSTKTVRSLAGKIVSGDETGSMKRLFEAVASPIPITSPDLRNFRTNQASSKVVLCAMWALTPRDLVSGVPIEPSQLSSMLDGLDGPADIAVDISPRRSLTSNLRMSAGNKLLIPSSDNSRTLEFLETIGHAAADLAAAGDPFDPDQQRILDSHSLSIALIELLTTERYDEFTEARESVLARNVGGFIKLKTGAGFELTPPLDEYDLDVAFDELEDMKNSTPVQEW